MSKANDRLPSKKQLEAMRANFACSTLDALARRVAQLSSAKTYLWRAKDALFRRGKAALGQELSSIEFMPSRMSLGIISASPTILPRL